MAKYSRLEQLEKKRVFAILQWNVRPLLASTISLLERQTRACSWALSVEVSCQCLMMSYICGYIYIRIYVDLCMGIVQLSTWLRWALLWTDDGRLASMSGASGWWCHTYVGIYIYIYTYICISMYRNRTAIHLAALSAAVNCRWAFSVDVWCQWLMMSYICGYIYIHIYVYMYIYVWESYSYPPGCVERCCELPMGV